MNGGGFNGKSSFLNLCDNKYCKEWHDVPFTGHVGMHKTLELMDKIDRPLGIPHQFVYEDYNGYETV